MPRVRWPVRLGSLEECDGAEEGFRTAWLVGARVRIAAKFSVFLSDLGCPGGAGIARCDVDKCASGREDEGLLCARAALEPSHCRLGLTPYRNGPQQLGRGAGGRFATSHGYSDSERWECETK